MLLTGRIRLKAQLNAVLIHADGTRENYGDMEARKPWYQRFWEFMSFDERGLVTDAGLNFLAQNFTGETQDVSLFKFHDCGTGTTAAVQTDTALQTPAGTARVSGTNTQTQSASGTGSTTPAIVTSVATISYVSSLAITEWGLFSATSGVTMWDHRVFAAINVVSGDSIQFTYSLSIPGGGT